MEIIRNINTHVDVYNYCIYIVIKCHTDVQTINKGQTMGGAFERVASYRSDCCARARKCLPAVKTDSLLCAYIRMRTVPLDPYLCISAKDGASSWCFRVRAGLLDTPGHRRLERFLPEL